MIVNLDDLAAGHNKRRIIQQAIFNELCKMLDTGKPSFVPKKGKTSVIMFVGLQGRVWLDKSCTKCSIIIKRKVSSGTSVSEIHLSGAFDHYMESDPVKIAVEGVERFKKENCDLIIVDTSGRHQQEASLFEEMRQLAESTKPDLVIFVMDSSIGQAAFIQAQAFNQSVSVGAVIVTKTEGAAKGGGALSAVAATKSPVIFLGTGEHMYDFEVFNVKPFVSCLLGIGDWSGFMEKIHDAVPMDQLSELLRKLSEGEFSLRIMYQLYENLLNVGPISQIFAMLPVNSAELKPKGDEKESWLKIKRYMTMMDSMTNEELDSTDPKFINESRIVRVARGSGRQLRDVMEMLEEYKRQAKVWDKMKGFFKIPKKCEKSALSRNMNPQQMSKVLPPQMLKQLGGMGGLQNIMKQMGS
ncbi:hypothetical protein MKW92_036455 [Papaver armeniacum]|nr:hypothetical protein MKW92_036455 [Papaver armeniacum]